MSLILNLLSSENRDREKEAMKQTGNNLASIAALSAGGYAFFEKANIKQALSRSSQILKNAGKQNELGALGASLRSSADNLAQFKERIVQNTITKMEEELNTNFDRVFNPETSLEEKRQFFAGLFDTLKSQTETSGDLELEKIIKAAYKDVDGLNDSQKETLKSFYSQRIRTSEKAKRALRSSINRYEGNIGLYADELATFDIDNDVKINTIQMSQLDEGYGKPETLGKIKSRYSILQGMAGAGATISLESIDEWGSNGTKSLYARVSYGNGRGKRFILSLGRNGDGQSVFRASESMATRYAAPLAVINAPAIFSQGRMDSLNMGTLQANTVDYEDHLFNMLKSRYSAPGSLRNMTQREYGAFNEYSRSFGMEAPRAMFSNLYEPDFIDERLASNIYSSRMLQSSMFKIVGLEHMSVESRALVQSSLLKYAPEVFGPVIGAGTTIDTIENPFDRNAGLVTASIRGLKKNGQEILNPLTAFKNYGILDRTIAPLTSRVEQLVGRPETFVGVGRDQADEFFGYNKDIRVSGVGSDLIGMSDKGSRIAGVNLGGIFLSEKKAAALGLAEGSAYIAGKVMQMEFEQKTVADIGVASTRIIDELIKKKKNPKQKFLKVGGAGADIGVEEFFKTYGGSDGDVILGDLDKDFVRIRNVKGLQSFNIGIMEQTEDLGRRRFHIGIPKLGEMPGNKLFGVAIKHTAIETNEALISAKLEAAGFDADEVLDIYKNVLGGTTRSNELMPNTVLMSTEQIKKSPQNILTSIVGGLRMFGINQDNIDNTLRLVLSDLRASNFKEKQTQFLLRSTEALLDSFNVDGNAQQKTALGHVFAILDEVAEEGKFGLNAGNINQVLERTALGQDADFLEGFRSGLHQGMGYSGGAGSRLNLGRGEARVEERFANYTYASLRSNYGLTEAESKAFMSSLLVRESGFEKKGASVAGMLLNLESLSKMPGDIFDERIKDLDLRRLNKDELRKLFSFGTNQESALIDFLSETKVGNIIDFSEFLNGEKLNRIKAQLGGRTQIILPGADTLQSLEGHEIKAGDKVMKLEAEYNRYMSDLVSSISGMSTNQGDEFEKSLSGFKSVSTYSSKYAGAAVRGVLTHSRILGSGQMEGQGYIFGTKDGGQTDIYSDPAKNLKARKKFLDLYNSEKGMFAMLDAQGFLDSHLSYEAAYKVHLASLNPERELKEIALEARAATQERVKNFFLNNFRSPENVRRVASTTMRNPLMYIAHMAPGSAIYRSDYLQEDDPYFSYLKRKVMGYSDGDYERIKEARLEVKKNEMRRHLIVAGITDSDKQDELLRGMEIETPEDKTARESIESTLKEFRESRTGIKAITGGIKEGEFVLGSAQNELIEKFRRRSLELYQGINYDEFQGRMKPLRDEMKALDELADDFFKSEIKAINDSMRTNVSEELDELDKKINEIIEESFDKPIERSRNNLRGLSGNEHRARYLIEMEKRRGREIQREPLTLDLKRNMMVPEEIIKLESELETLEKKPKENYEEIKAVRDKLSKAMRDMPFDPGHVRERDAFLVAQDMYEDILYNRIHKKKYIYGTQEDDAFQANLRKFYGIGEGGLDFGTLRDDEAFNNAKKAGREKFKAMKFAEKRAFIEEMSAFDNSGFLREYLNIETLKEKRKAFFETNAEAIKEEKARIKREIFTSSGPARDKQDMMNFFAEERARIKGEMDNLKKQAGFREVQAVSKRGATYTRYEEYNEEESKGKEAYNQQKKALREIDAEEKAYLEALDKPDKEVYERMQIRRSLERTLRGSPAFESESLEAKRNIIKLALSSIDEEELETDKIATNLSISKEKVTRTVRDLEAIETHLDRQINSFEDLAAVEKQIMSLSDDASVDIKGRQYKVKESFNKLFKGMLDYHIKQPGSGGTLYIPQIDVEFGLTDLEGKAVKGYSGRMDLSRFAIGDFDADIYQIFHAVDQDFSMKVGSGAGGAGGVDNSGLFRTGGHFLLMMDQLNKGMAALGERMLAGNLTDAEFVLDEQSKEALVKAVGNLDVQVKTGIFGIVQASASAGGGEEFARTSNRLLAGSALIAVAEEVLSIKAKKLPIAADIGGKYRTALSRSFEENNAEHLINFFEENVLRGTALEGSGFKVDKNNIKFVNLPDGAAAEYFREIYGGISVHKTEMYDAFREMVNTVHTQGLHSLGSDNRLASIIKNSDRMGYEQFVHLMSNKKSVQGGFLGLESGLNDIEEILSISRQASESFASFAGKTKGISAAVGVGLAAAYGFGAIQGINSLDGESKFSDAIAKESIGGRGLNNSLSREHNNIPPSNIVPPTNFYERTISSMQTTMTKNIATRFYGEAPSISAGQGVASQYVRSGGSSSFFINDSRMPISNSYITKSIKD